MDRNELTELLCVLSQAYEYGEHERWICNKILAAFDEKDGQIEALMKAVDASALLIMHMQSNDTEIGRLYSEAQQAIAEAREALG